MLVFDEQGLIPAIAQDRLTGQIRMVAWMNQEALSRTIETGRATFFSRRRRLLWQKGETSGNHLTVHRIYADCDGDTLLLLVEPSGPSCHTGRPTCFFRRLHDGGEIEDCEYEAGPFLQQLEREIQKRASAPAAASYTRALLDAGAERIGEKLREEASELAVALAAETPERVASEAADLVYHLLVGLGFRNVEVRQIIEVLARRAGTSGHAEKAARGGGSGGAGKNG